MERSLFDTYIVVDWSARSKPSPARCSKDAIWWAVERDDGPLEPRYLRTRYDAVDQLTDCIANELDAGRRVLAGFDFPFGYPAGVARRLTGSHSALALWSWIAARIEDRTDNGNNRFDVATKVNSRYPGVGPFWGRPGHWDYPSVPTRMKDRTFTDRHPPERRIADHRASGAKTVWQLAYAGSVGSQVLLGLPALERLRAAPRISGRVQVWPFETGLCVPDRSAAPLILAEIYPSLLKRQIARSRLKEEILDRAQVRVNAATFARLDRSGRLAPLFEGARELARRERCQVENEEAWILGLGHEQALWAACP